MMKVKRIIGMILVIVAGFLLQSSILPAFGWMNYIPNILVITVCAFGLTSGPYYGMLVGVLCGLLMDSVFGHRIGYYSLIFLYMGYLNGICQKYFFYDNLAVPLLACGLSDFCRQLPSAEPDEFSILYDEYDSAGTGQHHRGRADPFPDYRFDQRKNDGTGKKEIDEICLKNYCRLSQNF